MSTNKQDQHDGEVANDDHSGFGHTFATTIHQHLQRCVLGLPFIALILYQVSSTRPSLRLLTLVIATPYYCLLCLATSVMLSPLLYLYGQTAMLKTFLTSLVDTLVSPLKRLKSENLQDIHDSMNKKSEEVLEKEKRGVRKAVIYVLVTAVKRVLEMRFGEMINEGFTPESLGKIAGRELIGLVLGPVQQSVIAAIAGVSLGAAVFGVSPLLFLRVLLR